MATILLVEDDSQAAELMKFVLARAGYQVEHIMDGAQTVSKVRELRPVLIILDIMLPGLDGYSVQSKLLEEEDTKSIPILVMTAKNNMEEVFQTAGNVAAFMSKPFIVKEFVDKVQSILKK